MVVAAAAAGPIQVLGLPRSASDAATSAPHRSAAAPVGPHSTQLSLISEILLHVTKLEQHEDAARRLEVDTDTLQCSPAGLSAGGGRGLGCTT